MWRGSKIPLCTQCEIRKDPQKSKTVHAKIAKKSNSSKMKAADLLMKKLASFSSKICPVV